MSSGPQRIELFLLSQGFERAPWLTVAFASGIAAWFTLPNWRQWTALGTVLLAIALLAAAILRPDGRFPHLRQALIAVALMACAGIGVIWAKSALVGTPAIERPTVARITGLVIRREEQPSEGRARLIVATREPGGRSIRVRLNLPAELDRADVGEGAEVRLRARLVPPAPPMLPDGYNFAQTAWFAQLAATGTVLDPIEVVKPAGGGERLRAVQSQLSRHVREQLPGSAGAIAAAFASGDRGAIALTDEEAMRDAGLSHLLSISGLHVSALVGATYFVAIKLLALWPWLALRVRLPIMAAGAAALAGIGYTLLTGAEVPTVRSCLGALLVLAALALGREPLSLRMLAVAAFAVLLLWPESVVGPSFQLSFAAVLTIVSLHSSAPMKRFLGPREEGMIARAFRSLAALLVTGVAIEIALLPIGLFHFHRTGLYGALANVVAIPLTTFVTMPLIAAGLLLDLAGLGAPAWWLAGRSIDAMLLLAHWIAARPGAVTTMPAMGRASYGLFIAGGLWLALWRGRTRLWGLAPLATGTLFLALLRPPDILVSGDGRHVGITGERDGELLVLRDGRSSFTTENLAELAGMDGTLRLISDWQGARCSPDFCVLTLHREGRDWRLLLSRGREVVPERSLSAACERVDIVIADRWLPHSCRPRLLKADRNLLDRTGGLAIDLASGKVRTVAESQGAHGWWRPEQDKRPFRPATPASASGATGMASPASASGAAGMASPEVARPTAAPVRARQSASEPAQ